MTGASWSCGTDLVDCARIARMLQEDSAFLNLAFTASEQDYCQGDPACLGARWAAKESTMKALGLGIGKIAPLDVVVGRDEDGAPRLELFGSARARAEYLGVTDYSVSMTHEGGFAMAFVIMMKEGHDVRQ